MGLFDTKSTSENVTTTTNSDKKVVSTQNASQQDTSGTALSNIKLTGGSRLTLTDQGAIQAAFAFQNTALDKVLSFSSSVVGESVEGLGQAYSDTQPIDTGKLLLAGLAALAAMVAVGFLK